MSRLTQEPLKGRLHFHLRGCHPLWPAFPDRSINTLLSLISPKPSTLRSSRNRRLTALSCGPTTPGSPFESPGLGSSEFARHYFRNHCCFLLLRVLRWFTSPGLLRYPMDSDNGNACSHALGFPIRKSPDHSLLAASRSLSQLIASFIACLRQGIHTHALSSLTIKSTLRIHLFFVYDNATLNALLTCVLVMPVNIQLSKINFDSVQLSALSFQPESRGES